MTEANRPTKGKAITGILSGPNSASDTEYSPDRTRSVIGKLVQSDVRGVAIVTSSIDNSMTPELIEAGVGIVFCNLYPPGKLVSNISINYQNGVLQAIEHIVALGHHRPP
jgi:LacI family transcriptional regulator